MAVHRKSSILLAFFIGAEAPQRPMRMLAPSKARKRVLVVQAA
jgi:hypothetical protein